MVGITVHDCAAAREGRDYNHRDSGPAAEEVKRLNEARVPIAAALVKGNHEGGLLKQLRVGLELVKDVLYHAFQEIELRARRVPVDKAVGLDIRDRWQMALVEFTEKIN